MKKNNKTRSEKYSTFWKRRKLKKKNRKEIRRNRPYWARIPLFLLRFTLKTIAFSLIFTAIFGGIVGYFGYAWYQENMEEMVSENIRDGYAIAETIEPSHFEPLEPTRLVDANGETIRTFRERNYQYLDIQEDDELYEFVSEVTTVIEDERFYEHQGFDYLGVGVAVFDYVARGRDLRGASTLTQQLVKNTYLSQDQNIERKIAEAVIAQEMENQFTKREILEFYLNDAYFGRGNYGVETAARYYFNKTTADLNYRELATLIAIPNNPTIYDPIENPDNSIYRRNLILQLLINNGTIGEEDGQKAMEADLGLDVTPTSVDNSISDWAESLAVNKAVEELMRREGFEFEYWWETNEERNEYRERYNANYERFLQDILRGGYVIETSIDREMQEQLQNRIDNSMSQFTATDESGILSKQAPSVVIDNHTNEVVAIVGGRSQENNTSFNRGFQSARQPGSAIKPFLSYGPAFEQGLATETVRNDSPISNGPSNWYNDYWGNMSLRYAMEQSTNTIAYNLLQEVGLEYGRGKLEQMEFSNLRPDDRYPTIAVGGWTQGVSPLDMASAFNTLVNDGYYQRPTNVRRILSSQTDEVLYDREEDFEPIKIYESGVGYVTLNTLQSVVESGTGTAYSFDYAYEAGKTGTTNDLRELWYVGGTPHYTMSLYIGDNDPAYQNRASVGPTIESIYREHMRELHDGLEEQDFYRPSSVVKQNGNFWVRTEEDVDPKEERLEDESSRQSNVRQSQQNRVNSLAYRIVHGLTLEQAEARERIADARISSLEGHSLNGSEDLTEAEEMRDSAQEAIDDVVRDAEKAQFESRLATAFRNVQNERREIIAERERREELERERERRERELERREREEERRRQEENDADDEIEENDEEEDVDESNDEEDSDDEDIDDSAEENDEEDVDDEEEGE